MAEAILLVDLDLAQSVLGNVARRTTEIQGLLAASLNGNGDLEKLTMLARGLTNTSSLVLDILVKNRFNFPETTQAVPPKTEDVRPLGKGGQPQVGLEAVAPMVTKGPLA